MNQKKKLSNMDKQKIEMLLYNAKKSLENLKNYLIEINCNTSANIIEEIINKIPIEF